METTQTTGQETTAAMFALAQSINALARRNRTGDMYYKTAEQIEKLVNEQLRLSQLQFPAPGIAEATAPAPIHDHQADAGPGVY